jgi:D-amino-acid oxidase
MIVRMRITVVGAGVVGLTIAGRLADHGHEVRVRAADPPHATTSAIAAAIWYPYRAYPEHDVTRWSGRTYSVLSDLAAAEGTGVAMRTGRELFRAPTPDPWWAEAVPEFARPPPADLPNGYADGLRLTVPVVDMSVHLEWLVLELAKRAVPIDMARVTALDDVPGDVVVNCTGLGARELAPDPSMLPVRGQVVVVAQFGLTEWTLDDADGRMLTYIVPRDTTVVLGGTADEGAEDRTPQPHVAAMIVERCAALVPEVLAAPILRHRVGLRPTRPAVRLERETMPSGRPLIHCYGHGGAGVTLAQGCADDVAALVDGA